MGEDVAQRANFSNVTQSQPDLGPEMGNPEPQPIVFCCKLKGSAPEYLMIAAQSQPLGSILSQLGGAVNVFVFISWVEPSNATKQPTVLTGHLRNRLIPFQMPVVLTLIN